MPNASEQALRAEECARRAGPCSLAASQAVAAGP